MKLENEYERENPTIEVLKEDLGENQYRKAVIRIVTKSIVDQWDR